MDKKETVEEAFERMSANASENCVPNNHLENCNCNIFKDGLIAGASWKEKQMFTKEDMENIFIHTIAQRAIDNTPRLKGMRVWFDEFMKAYYPDEK